MIYQLTYKSSVASNHFFFDIKEMRWYCVIVFDSGQMTLFEKYSDNIYENRNTTNCEPFEYTLPDIINYFGKGDLLVELQEIESRIILLEILNKI
jgi:hypothetical protein